MKCSRCGRENAQGHRFCAECGKSVPIKRCLAIARDLGMRPLMERILARRKILKV